MRLIYFDNYLEVLVLNLWSDEQDRPLQHIRIIDCTIMFPGPLLTRILAQYGADVIKVENLPSGDPIRSLENSSLYELLLQGKRSIAVDLKTEAGRSIVQQLAGEADVFVENFREGVMDKMKLGYAELSEENPDLVYVSLRGLSGRFSVNAAHDLNFIANSGCGEWFLESGVPNYSTQFGDIIGGTLIPCLKLLFHLANPSRRGMHIISYMDESFRFLFVGRAFDSIKGEGKNNFGVHTILNGTLPHTRFYRCRDGQWVSLNAVQPKHWNNFCEIVDRNEWKERMNDQSLVFEMEKLFMSAPSTYWEALCSNREVCLLRVIPWEEHLSLSNARVQLTSDPLAWCGLKPNSTLCAPPKLGADTVSVLKSIGVSNKEISNLLQSKIVYQPEGGS